MKKYKDKKQYRYKGYDYSQDGFYFVTICTKNREIFFGEIAAAPHSAFLRYTEIGKIAERCWRAIPDHFSFVKLDEYIIMPNHLHGIIEIAHAGAGHCVVGAGHCVVGTGQCPVPTGGSTFGQVAPDSVSTIIGSFKSAVTKITNGRYPDIGFSWQSRFYDRIVRDNDELNRFRQYIMANPARWELDRNNQDDLIIL